MRRCTLRILVLLLLGAIVNVAVAWGFGFSQYFSLGVADRRLSREEIKAIWIENADEPYVEGVIARRLMTTRRYMGVGFTVVDIDDAVLCLGSGKAFNTTLGIIESGFPFRTLAHTTKWDVHTAMRLFSSSPPAPPTHVEWLSQSRMLWPGFAINTAFYAVILWLLFAGPFVVRRWRRIRRGLCPKCAYDLRGSPEPAACPECGASK